MHADTLTLILIMEQSRVHPWSESWHKGYMDQNDVKPIKCQCCPHIETSKLIDWFLCEGNNGIWWVKQG